MSGPPRRKPSAAPASVLSDEDIELLRLVAGGLPDATIARRLQVADRTVRRRLRRICDALGVSSRLEAAVQAAQQGLL